MVEVEPRHLGEEHVGVGLAVEDVPERRSDLDRRERSGRNLVGERLKEMEVLAIDERDVDVGAA